MMTLIRANVRPGIALDVGQSPMGTGAGPETLKGFRAGYARLSNRLEGVGRNLCRVFDRSRRPPLALELDGRMVRFDDPVSFEFSLKPRTEFPAARLARLKAWSPQDLDRMRAKIREVEQHLSDAIAESVERPQVIGALISQLDLKLFSQDHGWREIIAALKRCGPEHDVYKKIALVKYAQYLRTRQEVLRSLHAEQNGGASPLPAKAPRNGRRYARARDTEIIGPAQVPNVEEGFVALPRGETVCVRLDDSPEIEIRLSTYRFKLVADETLRLTDEYGSSFAIRPGKNLVGRQPECDVVIEPFYRGVSRKHLIIEPVSRSVVLMTDLSSHGTYVPKQAF